MLTTIYFLVIATPVPQTCFCNDWTEESFSCRAEALCFQDIIQIPFSSSIISDQRCYSNPDVDENTERGFGQSFSTFDQNYYSKNFCSKVI